MARQRHGTIFFGFQHDYAVSGEGFSIKDQNAQKQASPHRQSAVNAARKPSDEVGLIADRAPGNHGVIPSQDRNDGL